MNTAFKFNTDMSRALWSLMQWNGTKSDSRRLNKIGQTFGSFQNEKPVAIKAWLRKLMEDLHAQKTSFVIWLAENNGFLLICTKSVSMAGTADMFCNASYNWLWEHDDEVDDFGNIDRSTFCSLWNKRRFVFLSKSDDIWTRKHAGFLRLSEDGFLWTKQ